MCRQRYSVSDFALVVLKGISYIAPHAHILKLKNEDFSRAAVVEYMNKDSWTRVYLRQS